MKYGIVADSSCDLRDPAEWNDKETVFTSVPLKLDIGEKVFVDDDSFNLDEFMTELTAYKGKTGSAAPSPGEWMEAFEKADMSFAFTITSNLSGSYESAMVGRKMALERHPEKKIFVLDTLSTGPEMSLLVRRTKECIEKGMSFEEISENVTEYWKSTRLLFILEHMDNLVNNGRVSRLSGSLAGLLGIKIIGRASDDGRLDLLHKARGKFAIYNICVEEMLSRGFKGGRVVITHCQNPEKAEYVKAELLKHYPQSDIRIMSTGGLCAYYAERSGMLVGYEVEESN